MANGNGIHVSGRTIAAIVAIGAVITATWGAATFVAAQTGRISDLERRNHDMDLRTCRIEKALNIPPWPGCPQ